MRTAVARMCLALAVSFALLACSSAEPLMETPLLYQHGHIDPFAHLGPEQRTPQQTVFFASLRAPEGEAPALTYGNTVSDRLHLGRARVQFGDDAMTWERLHRLSLAPEREEAVDLAVEAVEEVGTLATAAAGPEPEPGARAFFAALDQQLARVEDPEILVYVHGTKVGFQRGCARLAEFTHFAGRDFVPLLLDWPSHENILAYVSGIDVRRAHRSARPLRILLEALARHTRARRIHVLCYSAGAIVAGEALLELRQQHPDLDHAALQRHLRIGAVTLCGADVPVHRFLTELPAIHDLAERVTVTASDADDVLDLARRWMGGGGRVGYLAGDQPDPEFTALIAHLPRFELIDVSHDKERRGFDIAGHHYWYRHPWVSSDVILNVRTDLPAHRRGLLERSPGRIWYLPADYHLRSRDAALRELRGQW